MSKILRVSDARQLLNNKTNIGAMRPYIGKDGNPYVYVFTGGDRKKKANYQKIPVDNAALRYDEWKTFDDILIKIAEERLVGYDDLRSRGLVYTLNNPMATTVLQWEVLSDAMEAYVSMDPIKRGDGDLVDHAQKYIPIPITHADFTISERLLQASRNRGDALDTSSLERAGRRVAEQQEDMLFSATSTLTYGGGTIYSYLSFPDKNTVTFTGWLASAMTPALIKDDVLAMKQASIDAKRFGPWMVYIPTAYETLMDDDYDVSGQSLKTIRERLLQIGGIVDIKVVDRLPADKVLMVQLTSDVVDLVDGMPMQTVEWSTEGGMVHNYKVMMIAIPRIKSDYNGSSGITILSI